MQALDAVLNRPLECGDQPAVLGDVVRRDSDAGVELRNCHAVFVSDDSTVPCGAGVAAGAPVDVRRDHQDADS